MTRGGTRVGDGHQARLVGSSPPPMTPGGVKANNRPGYRPQAGGSRGGGTTTGLGRHTEPASRRARGGRSSMPDRLGPGAAHSSDNRPSLRRTFRPRAARPARPVVPVTLRLRRARPAGPRHQREPWQNASGRRGTEEVRRTPLAKDDMGWEARPRPLGAGRSMN